VLDCSVPRALANLGGLDLIPEALVKGLLGAHRLLRQLECILAVALDGPVGRERLSGSLASLLVRAGGARDLQQLEEAAANATATVRAAFGEAVDRAHRD
jgi:hypothetical protein